MTLDEFIEDNRDAALTYCDEQMFEYVSPEEIEEYADVYTAYCELCNGEAESDTCYEFADRFIEAGGEGNYHEIVSAFMGAWF